MLRFTVKIAIATVIVVTNALVATAATAAGTENSQECVSTAYGCTTDAYSGTAMAYTAGYLSNAGHNCTMYAAYKIYLYKKYSADYMHLGDASTWATRAAALPGVVVSSTPHIYDVAQWNFGHVAWVESVQTDATGKVTGIVITDDNYNLKITTRKILHPGSIKYIAWPDNFITFPSYGRGSGGPQFQIAPLLTANG